MVDLDEVNKWLENSSPLGYKAWKPVYGASKEKPHENKIKLLSWPPDKGPLALKVEKHFGLGSDGKRQAICPKTYGIKYPCPICEFVDAAAKGGDPTLVKRAQDVMKKERYLQLVIDWEAFEKEEENQVVEIYDCPPKVHRDIMQKMSTQKHDLTAYESALVSLSCYSQGLGKPKAVAFGITQESMTTKFVKIDPEFWLPKVPDLHEAGRALSPAKLQALLDGEEDGAAAPEPEKEEVAGQGKDEIPMDHKTDKPENKDPNWAVKGEQKEAQKNPVEAPKQQTTSAPTQTSTAQAPEGKKKPTLQELIDMNKAKTGAK